MSGFSPVADLGSAADPAAVVDRALLLLLSLTNASHRCGLVLKEPLNAPATKDTWNFEIDLHSIVCRLPPMNSSLPKLNCSSLFAAALVELDVPCIVCCQPLNVSFTARQNVSKINEILMKISEIYRKSLKCWWKLVKFIGNTRNSGEIGEIYRKLKQFC